MRPPVRVRIDRASFLNGLNCNGSFFFLFSFRPSSGNVALS